MANPARTRRRVAVCLLVAGMAGCAGNGTSSPPAEQPATTQTAAPTETPTATPSWQPSVDPKIDLLIPGQVEQVVTGLVSRAQGPIVRVAITRTSARVTWVGEGDRPASAIWDAGNVSVADDGTDLVTAKPFNPADFAYPDIASLFAQAAEISGSAQNQELQINEYNQGQVLITVTTNPETTTVFFNPDGTLIPRLDLFDDADIATAIQDVTKDESPNALVITPNQQVAADYQLSAGIIERRTRPANGPVYTTQRKGDLSPLRFDVAQLDHSTLGVIVRTYPGMLSGTKDTPITLTIRRTLSDPAPRIKVDVGTESVLLRLDGTRVSEG